MMDGELYAKYQSRVCFMMEEIELLVLGLRNEYEPDDEDLREACRALESARAELAKADKALYHGEMREQGHEFPLDEDMY